MNRKAKEMLLIFTVFCLFFIFCLFFCSSSTSFLLPSIRHQRCCGCWTRLERVAPIYF